MHNAAQPTLCSVSNLGACDPADLVKMPVKLFSRRLFVFPMSAADIAANFPSTFELFRTQSGMTVVAPSGITVTSSNLMGGDQVPCPFLLCGVCVSLTPEPEMWTANGAIADITAAAAAGPATPAYTGFIDATVANTTGLNQGTLEIGGATWRAAVDILLAYRLKFLLQCKYELFDVALADVGCIDSASQFQGAGDCLTPVAPYVQFANERYQGIGSNKRFLPPNLEPPAVGGTTGIAAAPTTRKIVGGPKMQGSLAGFYMCPAPILLSTCCRINMSLHQGEGDDFYLQRLRYEAADHSARGYAPEWTSGLIAGTLAAGDANVYTMKFGALSFQVTLIGYDVELSACQDYFSQSLPPSLLEMYGAIPSMPGHEAARLAGTLGGKR